MEYNVYLDTKAPEIKLRDLTSDIIETTDDRFLLNGEVDSDTASVFINGITGGLGEFNKNFGKVYTLQPGDNTFEIKATDWVGNSTTRVIRVIKN